MAATLDPDTAARLRANQTGAGYGATTRADQRNTGIRPGQNPDLPTNEQKAAAAATRVNAQNQAVRDRDPYGKPLGSMGDPSLPGATERLDMIGGMLSGAQGRQAPQAQGATISPMQQAQGAQAQQAQLAAAQRAQAATLGPAAQAGPASFGAAGSAAASKIAPTERAQDSAFRGGQQETANFLSGLMRGDNSLAALQAKRSGDQAIAAQMAMSRSGRPGMGGMNARLASQNIGKIQGDLAGRLQEAQLAERMGAANQLSGLLGTARGQDLSLSQFNAAQGNEAARLQAQLGTQTSIANAGNQTQMGIAQGQTGAQIGMFNAGQSNAQAQQAAAFQQQAALANQQAENQRAFEQANLFQQGQQFNAQLGQQNQQFNVGAQNAAALEQARLAQQAGQFNVGAQLQQTGMNDSFTQGLLNQQLGTQQLQQQGNQFGMSLEQQRYLQKEALDKQRAMLQMQINAQKGMQPSTGDKILGGILGAGTAILPALL